MGVAIWLLWIVLAILTLAGELLTLGLFFASLSLAALVTAVASLVLPLPAQMLVFCIVALLMLVAVRPVALRFLPRGTSENDVAVLGPLGHRALTTEPVTSLGGQIRVGSGQFWSARPEHDEQSIAEGAEVEVVRMEGLTAMVRPIDVSPVPPQERRSASTFGLSAREVEVLQLLARGLSNADIAAQLVLSQRTVDHHVSHILNKMDASSRMEAVRRGLEKGIVRLDSGAPAE